MRCGWDEDTSLVQNVTLGWIVWFTFFGSEHSINFTQCLTGAGDAPLQFLEGFGHFWVNRVIHLFVPKIDPNWLCSFPRACTGPLCDFWCVLSFWLDLVTIYVLYCPISVSAQFLSQFCFNWIFLFSFEPTLEQNLNQYWSNLWTICVKNINLVN